MTAAAYPSAFAADDDDDDGPAAGLATDRGGRRRSVHRVRRRGRSRARRGRKRCAGGRTHRRSRATQRDGSGAGGGRRARGTEHPPPARGRAPSPKRPRIHSAPSAFLANVTVPSAPPGECTHVTSSGVSLQTKVEQWLELKRRGTEIDARLRATKGFRNPDFLRSAVTHFDVDDRGTNFAEDVFDPKGYDSGGVLRQVRRGAEEGDGEARKGTTRAGFHRKMDFRSASTLAALAKGERGRRARGRRPGSHRTRQERGVGARGESRRREAMTNGASRVAQRERHPSRARIVVRRPSRRPRIVVRRPSRRPRYWSFFRRFHSILERFVPGLSRKSQNAP